MLIVGKMRFKVLFILSLLAIYLSISGLDKVEGASDSFVDGIQEYYIVKEVIEVTSDWQDIKWIQGPQVIDMRYSVVEGADAVKNLDVTGLTVWITQKSLDTVKVVLEVEALVIKGNETAQVVIEKGAIGSANVELTVYDASTGSFSDVTEFSSNSMFQDFELDIASLYTEPAGNLMMGETLKDLKGKVLSFYYPWYASPHGPSSLWHHWTNVTDDSIFDSAHYPLHGSYDSNDENVIRSHMAIAKQAGIDAFIVSWWGIESFEEKPVDRILRLAEQMELNITFYYESVRDLTKDEIVDELTYLVESYSDHPAFLKVSGKPVIFVYAVSAYSRDPGFWLDVRSLVEENVGSIVLIGDTADEEYLHVFDGFHVYIHLGEDVAGFYQSCVNRFEVGISTMDTDELFTAAYSGDDIDMMVKPFFLTVTPGFDTSSWGQLVPNVARLDGETYAGYWEVVEEIGPHSVLITSWNEWHEGTELEPSREHGFDYINMTKGYIEEYKETSVPEPDTAFSAVIGPFRQNADLTGVGKIIISTEGVPALYVNVSVKGETGVTNLDLEGDFSTYMKRMKENYVSIIIPSVPPNVDQAVEVIFEAEFLNPTFTVSVTAFDPIGKTYELSRGEVNSVVTLPRLSIDSDYGSVTGGGSYVQGSTVSFSVSPTTVLGSSGVRHVFISWDSNSPGGYTGSENPAEAVIYNDIVEVALWKTQYYLTVIGDIGGSVTSSGWFDAGSEVTISATPNSGFTFSSWISSDLGAYSGVNSIYTVTLNGPITERPVFLDVADPIADAGLDRTCFAGETIAFNAMESSDNVGIVYYEWDFGDGVTEAFLGATHVYDEPGTYTVTLTVKDRVGNDAKDTVLITVKERREPFLEKWGFPMWIIYAIGFAILMNIVLILLVKYS
jgi:hypothetical protein